MVLNGVFAVLLVVLIDGGDATFLAALEAVDSTDDTITADSLRLEIADAAAALARFEIAISALDSVTSPREQRYARLRLATACAEHGDVPTTRSVLQSLVASDATLQQEAGRLAAVLLDANVEHSRVAAFLDEWREPFASDAARYEYLKRSPLATIEEHLPHFTADEERDWGRLLLARRYREAGNLARAREIANSFTGAANVAKRVWCLIALEEWDAAIREAATIDDAETRSVTQRLLGRRLQRLDLLSASLNAADTITSPALAPRRLQLHLFAARAWCSIAKDSAQDQLETPRQIVRDVIAVAAASPDIMSLETWEALVELQLALGEPLTVTLPHLFTAAARRGDPRRFAAVLARFVNDDKNDQKTIPLDESEEASFSPFAIDDCGC